VTLRRFLYQRLKWGVLVVSLSFLLELTVLYFIATFCDPGSIKAMDSSSLPYRMDWTLLLNQQIFKQASPSREVKHYLSDLIAISHFLLLSVSTTTYNLESPIHTANFQGIFALVFVQRLGLRPFISAYIWRDKSLGPQQDTIRMRWIKGGIIQWPITTIS